MNKTAAQAFAAFVHMQQSRAVIHVRVVCKPAHTKNLFGPIEEIAGKKLQLLERNDQGDCLCLFTGRQGTNIVDVDYRDVES